jgi:hypothetical protein
MQMQLRPAGRTDISWSNTANIRFTSGITNPPVPDYMQNMKNYIKMVPGWAMIYNGVNNEVNPKQYGLSRIQYERKIEKCGVTMIPWRFTKENKYVWWGASLLPPPSSHDGQKDLRWLIVDPQFSFPSGHQLYAFNNYIWGFKDQTIPRWTGDPAILDPIRDLWFSNTPTSHLYQTTDPNKPNYILAPKTFSRFAYIMTSPISGETTSGYNSNCTLVNSTQKGVWKVRMERDYVNISNGQGLYNYSGEAVRVDYYEGNAPLDTGTGFRREAWYYVKDVGVVKVDTKLFNNYAGSGVRYCKDDSDCWDDTIRDPDYTITLKQIFQNPTLSVQVSTNNVNYSTSITTTQANGYWLKVNPPYTGYLEANSSPPKRWLWVQDGKVFVPNPYAPGTYNSKFRIWIPNEIPLSSGETPVSTPEISWSNLVTVTVNASADATCTNSTWDTGYNFNGNNWCPANNQLCATNWITSPQVPVNCGTKKLRNVGNYCTKSNGTKSFTGNSSCID